MFQVSYLKTATACHSQFVGDKKHEWDESYLVDRSVHIVESVSVECCSDIPATES